MEVGGQTGRLPMPTHRAPAIRVPRTADGLAAPLQQVDRTHVLHHGRKLVYLAGCDYFRLASHPQVLAALHRGLDEFGLNVAASRRTTGNHQLYETLEDAAAEFFDVESATLISNGYQTNLCVAQALAGDVTHAVLDERAHGSLQDAAQLLGGAIRTFHHLDPADARRAIKSCGARARIVLMTDGLQSHSGEIAPLADYLSLLPHQGRLWVDDAHGAGVLGRHGRGSLEYLDVNPAGDDRLIQTVTLSKAFGVYGGLVLGSRALRKRLVERSRIFIGNTPLPLPLAAGAVKAMAIVRAQPSLRRRLIFNTAYVRSALREAGVAVNDGPGPIIPIHPRSAAEAEKLCRALRRAGIHPPLIQYQGGPSSAYFRFALSSEHDGDQLERLVKAIAGACSTKATES